MKEHCYQRTGAPAFPEISRAGAESVSISPSPCIYPRGQIHDRDNGDFRDVMQELGALVKERGVIFIAPITNDAPGSPRAGGERKAQASAAEHVADSVHALSNTCAVRAEAWVLPWCRNVATGRLCRNTFSFSHSGGSNSAGGGTTQPPPPIPATEGIADDHIVPCPVEIHRRVPLCDGTPRPQPCRCRDTGSVAASALTSPLQEQAAPRPPWPYPRCRKNAAGFPRGTIGLSVKSLKRVTERLVIRYRSSSRAPAPGPV
jgi:hypothetical protein